jgi:GcrA cell cycle regulator
VTRKGVSPSGGSWTPERIQRLRKLAGEGRSAAAIALLLGDTTRSAVIGKISRDNIRWSKKNGLRNKKPSKPSKRSTFGFGSYTTKPKPTWLDPLDLSEDLVVPEKDRRTVETLMDADCRWPFGDVGKKDFHFCGKKKVNGLPYCEFHARRAYVPSPVSRETSGPVHTVASSVQQETLLTKEKEQA